MFKRNKLLKYSGVFVVVLMLFAIVGKKTGCLGGGKKIKVSIEKVERRTIKETVIASGKIYPQVEVKISPDVSGEIVFLAVKEGDSVNHGDILVKINPDVYSATVERMQASVNTSKANLANSRARLLQAIANLEKVVLDHKRNIELHDKKIISNSEFETSESTYKSTMAEKEAAVQSVKASEFTVLSTEASLKEAKNSFQKTTITAPVTGTVYMLAIEKGERVVGTSQMTGTDMMRLANLTKMEVRVDVSENDIVRVGIGDTASIEVDAYLDHKIKGVVEEIASSSEIALQGASDQVTNFTVKIRILDDAYREMKKLNRKNNHPFLPGMSASVEIQTNVVTDVIAVPLQAVTTRKERAADKKKRGDNEQDKQEKSGGDTELDEIVFIYDKGKAKVAVVKTGVQDNEYIEIKEGLEETQEIITAPYNAVSRILKDGSELDKVDKHELFDN